MLIGALGVPDLDDAEKIGQMAPSALLAVGLFVVTAAVVVMWRFVVGTLTQLVKDNIASNTELTLTLKASRDHTQGCHKSMATFAQAVRQCPHNKSTGTEGLKPPTVKLATIRSD